MERQSNRQSDGASLTRSNTVAFFSLGLPREFSKRTRDLPHDRKAMGVRLRDQRLNRGLTLGDVARALGVTTACVCQWEAGKCYPKRQFWPQLAQVVGTTVSELIAGEHEPARTWSIPPDDVVRLARIDIAAAFGVDPSKVRIEFDLDPANPQNK